MNYKEATDYLFNRKAKGMKLGLENMRNLLEKLGHPEKRFPSVQIAGTNGKGSTAAILESILRKAGYKTGLYTSPHLIDMRERITLSGEHISESAVLEILEWMHPHIESSNASFFEILTAMSFVYFADQGVDIAVLETGLGGRLDATTLVTPILSVITEIGLDHTKILGKSVKEITGEKAGILKPGVTCVSGASSEEVRAHLSRFAREKQAPLVFSKDRVTVSSIRLTIRGTFFNTSSAHFDYSGLRVNLLGEHQVKNAVTAIQAVDHLNRNGWRIPQKALRDGLASVDWPARLQLIREKPRILIDSAHNPMGMQTLVDTLKTLFADQKLIFIFGVLADKDYPDMFSRMAPLADRFIFTKPLSDRALEPDELLKMPGIGKKPADVIPDIGDALRSARSHAGPGDLICCAGSIYFVGEILRLLGNQPVP